MIDERRVYLIQCKNGKLRFEDRGGEVIVAAGMLTWALSRDDFMEMGERMRENPPPPRIETP